jgi:hypothetical protein
MAKAMNAEVILFRVPIAIPLFIIPAKKSALTLMIVTAEI